MQKLLVLSLILLIINGCSGVYPNGRVAFVIEHDSSVEDIRVNGARIKKGEVYYAHKGLLEIVYIRDTDFGRVEELITTKIRKSTRYFLNNSGLVVLKDGQSLVYE